MSHDLALPTLFADRTQAGRSLVEPLTRYAGRPDVIVLALPRGGVPVAYEVATALNVRLDASSACRFTPSLPWVR